MSKREKQKPKKPFDWLIRARHFLPLWSIKQPMKQLKILPTLCISHWLMKGRTRNTVVSAIDSDSCSSLLAQKLFRVNKIHLMDQSHRDIHEIRAKHMMKKKRKKSNKCYGRRCIPNVFQIYSIVSVSRINFSQCCACCREHNTWIPVPVQSLFKVFSLLCLISIKQCI